MRHESGSLNILETSVVALGPNFQVSRTIYRNGKLTFRDTAADLAPRSRHLRRRRSTTPSVFPDFMAAMSNSCHPWHELPDDFQKESPYPESSQDETRGRDNQNWIEQFPTPDTQIGQSDRVPPLSEVQQASMWDMFLPENKKSDMIGSHFAITPDHSPSNNSFVFDMGSPLYQKPISRLVTSKLHNRASPLHILRSPGSVNRDHAIDIVS